MSKEVRDELKNQPDLLMPSLGTFEFKNVDEPMEVFALAKDGFAVPKSEEIQGKFKSKPQTNSKQKKWLVPAITAFLLLSVFGLWRLMGDNSNKESQPEELILTTPLSKEARDKRVVIMIFENQTMDPNLDAFGKMISDWISSGLMETGDANVIDAANIQNQIQLAQAGLLKNLTEEILGYWSVRKQSRFKDDPPKFEAYQNYVEGSITFNDQSKTAETETYLTAAYQIDPTFYAPLLKLSVMYGNMNSSSARDSILKYIDTQNPKFTKWEKLRFESIKASAKSDWIKAAKINEQMYAMDASDDNANYNAANFYGRANRPYKKIELLTSFDQRYREWDAEYSWREQRLAEAYFRTEQYEKVIETVENYSFPKHIDGLAQLHVRTLIRLDRVDEIASVIGDYNRKGIISGFGTERKIYTLWGAIVRELYLSKRMEILDQYIDIYEDEVNKNEEQNNAKNRALAFSAYIESDYKSCISHWSKITPNENSVGRSLQYHAFLGVCSARLGNSKEANQHITAIIDINDNLVRFFGMKKYRQATISLALGEEQEALKLLKESITNGTTYYPYALWANYILLTDLFDDPEFQKMAQPKGE